MHMENELQNDCGTPRSVGGGVKLFGLSAFSASFSGPGSLALALFSLTRMLCGCCALARRPPAKAAPATAIVVVPRSRRARKSRPPGAIRSAGWQTLCQTSKSPWLIPLNGRSCSDVPSGRAVQHCAAIFTLKLPNPTRPHGGWRRFAASLCAALPKRFKIKRLLRDRSTRRGFWPGGHGP